MTATVAPPAGSASGARGDDRAAGGDADDAERSAPVAPVARLWADLGDGGRIAYTTQPGPGLAIVAPLSYGVTLDGLEAAAGQGQFLQELAAGSYLVTYDQRGSGASAEAGAPASWGQRGDDLWRVADAAGAERAVLYGVADAGHTVVHAAAQRPDRVLALILNFVPPTFAATAPGEGVPAERARRWAGAGGDPRLDAIEMMRAFGIGGGDAADLVDAWRAAAGPEALEETRRLFAEADIRPLLGGLPQPALVLEPRRAVMVRGWGSAVASLLPQGRLVCPARGVEALGAIHGFLSLLEADMGRRASRLSPAQGQALERGEAAMRALHRIAVAVDDDAASARAVELACRLGEAQRAEIVLVHVVAVPHILPLAAPPPDMVERGERALGLGDAIVQRHGLPPPLRRLVRGRTVARAILAAADEARADLIVVANSGGVGGGGGAVVEELLRRAPGKVIVDRAGA